MFWQIWQIYSLSRYIVKLNIWECREWREVWSLERQLERQLCPFCCFFLLHITLRPMYFTTCPSQHPPDPPERCHRWMQDSCRHTSTSKKAAFSVNLKFFLKSIPIGFNHLWRSLVSSKLFRIQICCPKSHHLRPKIQAFGARDPEFRGNISTWPSDS